MEIYTLTSVRIAICLFDERNIHAEIDSGGLNLIGKLDIRCQIDV